MTCASCAARVEKKLNRMDGVSATVNYATEKARVAYAESVNLDDLVGTVEATGYTATAPKQQTPVDRASSERQPEPETADEATLLRQRLIVSIALTVPVVLMAMVPVLQFDSWQWLSLTLAAPVVVWAAWPFHRAALANA
ncbi:MAG: cation transporter, partial [Nocardioidaceae bacterium]